MTFLGFPRSASIIVTGAASGIGRRIAHDAARLGLGVSAWDVDEGGLAGLQGEVSDAEGRVLPLCVDVDRPSEIAEALDRTAAELGPVGHLVNNAGPSSFGGLEFDDGLVRAVGSVRHVTAAWLQRPGSHDGSVVNISSVAGSITGGGATDWYAAAKAAIAGYTRFLALNRPNGVRANAVAPGFTRTPRTEAFLDSEAGVAALARNPMQRAAGPEEISPAVLFLLSPAASYVNGALLPVDGGAVIVL